MVISPACPADLARIPLNPREQTFVAGVYSITVIFQPEGEYNNSRGWIGIDTAN